MTKLLSFYPQHLLERALDPFDGFPAMMKWFPKIVEAKEILDRWYFEEQASAWRDRRKNTIALEPPPPDEETCAKMIDKFNGLLAELRGNMAVS